MLEPVLYSILNKKKIVLASGSPRRKEILKNIGLQFDVIPSEFDENSLPESNYKDKKDYVLDLAEHKVLDVLNNLMKSKIPDLIIGADTIVEFNDQVLGKPADKNQAVEYLKMLNGQIHTVHTAIIIKAMKGGGRKFVESTKVHMAPLNLETIKSYVETGDPLDTAGAYGIQGRGGSLIEKIDGDFFNVSGLPLHKFCINLLSLLEEL